jgi:hypothetical protein
MAMQSNHHEHWMDGSLEEWVLLLAIIAMVALPPLVMLFYQ